MGGRKFADAIKKKMTGGTTPPIQTQLPGDGKVATPLGEQPQGKTLLTPSAPPPGQGVGPQPAPKPAQSAVAAPPAEVGATLPPAKQKSAPPAGMPAPPTRQQATTVITDGLTEEQKNEAEKNLHLNLAKNQLNVVKEEVLHGKYDDALRDAKEIRIPETRDEAYAVIARSKANAGKDKDAKDIADNIKNNAVHAAVLKDIAEAQQKAGRVIESKATLKKAERLAKKIPENVPERKPLLDEVDELRKKAEKKIEGNEDLKSQEKRMIRNKILKWTGTISGLLLSAAIALYTEARGKETYEWVKNKAAEVVVGKDNMEKLKKLNGEKEETAPAEETAGEEQILSLLSPEEAKTVQNYLRMGFPIARNTEIDIDKLRAYRPLEHIEADKKALNDAKEGRGGAKGKELVKKVTEDYLKEEIKGLNRSLAAKEDEKKKLYEEIKELDDEIKEMGAQAEVDKIKKQQKLAELKREKSGREWKIGEIEGNITDLKAQLERLSAALNGEDEAFLKEKQKEALEAKLKILEDQKIENEKLQDYLKSDAGMELTKDTYCPSEGIVAEGNNRCDKKPDVILIGKDNKVILVLNPYYIESNSKNGLCPGDCKAGAAGEQGMSGYAD